MIVEKWGQTPILLIEIKTVLINLRSDPDIPIFLEKMGSDPDIPNRDKNCVNKSEVRPRYS
jgi:hypothetical protein